MVEQLHEGFITLEKKEAEVIDGGGKIFDMAESFLVNRLIYTVANVTYQNAFHLITPEGNIMA